MCFSSLVLSRRPKIFKKRPKTLKNSLTPIGSCRDLHILCIVDVQINNVAAALKGRLIGS